MQFGADLEPDDDVIYRFLYQWFAPCTGGEVELGWCGSDGKLNQFRRFPLDELEAAARFAYETNAREGQSVYFRPATVRPDTRYTRDVDVVQIPGCWVDCDDEQTVQKLLAADGVAPTSQIVTGRIPELRSQFVWQSSGHMLGSEAVRDLNRRIQHLVGGDPAVINPSSLLRLPGTIAWPRKPGRVPELTEWLTPAGGGDSVSIDTLKSWISELTPQATAKRSTMTTTELLNPIQFLIEQARAGPPWHDPVLRLVAMLVARSTPSAAILAMAEHLTLPGYTLRQTRNELQKMIDGAREKGFGSTGVDDVLDVPSNSAPTFPLMTKDELLSLPAPHWLVPDLLVADTLSVLYGQFRSYKSFIALDWALCLASGTEWSGRPITRCDVLYIAGEGVGGLKLRVAAWLQHRGVDGPVTGFRVLPLAVNLKDKAEAELLIQRVTEENETHGFDPKLVIVDTLHRSMRGADENSAKDMGIVISNAALIQRHLGCSLLAVHHAGKDAERGLRGSSRLPGAADTIIRVNRTDDYATLRVEKQKDSEDGQELQLRSQVVNIPPEPDSMTSRCSLVMVPDDGGSHRRQLQLTPLERKARQYLADLIVAEGRSLPQGGGYPSPIAGQLLQGVPISRWRDECEARQLSTAETKRNRTGTFRRIFQALLLKNSVAARDELVWLAY